MKKTFATRAAWLALLLCLAMVFSGGVLAEAIQPDSHPGLVAQGTTQFQRPAGEFISGGPPAEGEAFLPDGGNPEVMSWTTLMMDDFEGVFPGAGWTLYNGHPTGEYLWGQTNYHSYSPDKSVFPAGSGSDAYDPRDSYYVDDMLSWMQYGPMNLSTAAEARLEFQVWMDTETYSDNLYICASNDNEMYYCHIFSGTSAGWDFMSFSFSDWPAPSAMIGEPQVWIAFIFFSNEVGVAQGVFLDDVVVRSTTSSAEPDLMPITYLPDANVYHPGDSFYSYAYFINVGSAECPSYDVEEYLSTDAIVTTGDIQISTTTVAGPISPSEQWYTEMSPTIPAPTAAGMYYLGVIYSCVGDTETGNDVLVYPNQIEITDPGVGGVIFQDNFEMRDLTSWTRFNPGRTGLSVCSAGAMYEAYGACFYRPAGNDKRRQIIDETPVDQTTFNVRFNFDINSLSMLNGERFRFVQTKMGAERPFFIVLKFQGGQYYIQLNTLLDDLSKTKTSWYELSDAAHVIEVDWQAASGPGANDGYADLYVDDALLESMDGLDNDTLFVENFKVGFTSRLAGKSISGMFYVDDVTTSSGGHIGLP